RDVGGQPPVDLVEGGRQAALHVRQRHVGDGGVERLHDGRAHGADRHQHATRFRNLSDGRHSAYRGVFAPAYCATLVRPRSEASERWRPLSMETLALMPARRRLTSSPASMALRTGTRCTTFTQFPLAFCGGRIANCAPVPGLMAATVPWNVWLGNVSMSIATFWPMRRWVMSVSLGLASTQGWSSSMTLSTGVPAATERPSWMLATWVAVPPRGARSTVWERSRSACSSAALAWMNGGNFSIGRSGSPSSWLRRSACCWRSCSSWFSAPTKVAILLSTSAGETERLATSAF